jgi:hypothetical protein
MCSDLSKKSNTQKEDFSFLFVVPTGEPKVLAIGMRKRGIRANDLITVGGDMGDFPHA